jgi:wyosine [tRNA(Phe)-imidazoG37] synthetase (radical SAM superfamily)
VTEGQLSTADHRTDAAGLEYVYAVVSRRAGGVSVGVNLNPNNACNWRCVYCQVPGLTRGAAPALDLDRLERELRGLLTDIVHGGFMARRVPADLRRLESIAFSGNGEPTSSPQFPVAVERVGTVLEDLGLAGRVRVILITNGSRVMRPATLAGLRTLAAIGGEAWLKVDRGTPEGIRQVNSVELSPEQVLRHLTVAAGLCPTWVQTCMFTLDGEPPDARERTAYLELLAEAVRRGVRLQGVLLYGVARPSLQPEAPRLGRLPEAWLQALAREIEGLGLPVVVTP